MDDRRPDIFSGQGQGLVGLRAEHRIECAVVQVVGELCGSPTSARIGVDELCAAAVESRLPSVLVSKMRVPIAWYNRTNGVASVFGPGARRHPQQAQPSSVAVLVVSWEMALVVHPCIVSRKEMNFQSTV